MLLMVFTKPITAPTFLKSWGSVVASHFMIWSSTLPPPVAKARAISAAICAASSSTLNTFLKSSVRNFFMPAITALYSFCIPANKPSTALHWQVCTSFATHTHIKGLNREHISIKTNIINSSLLLWLTNTYSTRVVLKITS